MKFYASAKGSGETSMHSGSVYGLDTVSLRFFDTFGPRQSIRTLYGSVIPEMANLVLAGRQPVIYGDGEQTRDLNYVDNAVYAMLLAATDPKPFRAARFNVGSGRPVSIHYVASSMAELSGRPDLVPVYEPERGNDIRHLHPDISLARQVLGYEPLVSFEDGLKKTLRWFLDHGFIKGRAGWQLT